MWKLFSSPFFPFNYIIMTKHQRILWGGKKSSILAQYNNCFTHHFYCLSIDILHILYFTYQFVFFSYSFNKTLVILFIEVELIYSVLISQQNDSVIHISQITFPYRLLQDIEYSFLCYMVGWLSILNILGKCSILRNSMHSLKACLNTMSIWTLSLVRRLTTKNHKF